MSSELALSRRQGWAFASAVVVLSSLALAGLLVVFTGRERTPRTLETRDPRFPCGNLCVAAVSHLLERPVTLGQTTHALPVDPEGISSLLELQQALQ
jgi:hypothetical protein